MTKAELTKAKEIALSTDVDLSHETRQIDIFNGFAMSDFKPVHVTVEMVAALIRWQALAFNGTLVADELNQIANLGRKRFLIV